MKPPLRLALALAVTFVAMTAVLLGTQQSAVPFISPGELNHSLGGKRVQVEGTVQRLVASEGSLRFALADGAGATVTVIYRLRDQRPLTLDEGRLAIAKGIYRDGVVEAQQVSVRAHEE